MSQDRSNWNVTCRTCSAKPGEPCTVGNGARADRVHWGRPRYRERSTFVRRPKPASPQPWYARVDPEDVSEYERRRFKD